MADEFRAKRAPASALTPDVPPCKQATASQKMHDKMLSKRETLAEGERPLCVISLRDARLERGDFFAVMLTEGLSRVEQDRVETLFFDLREVPKPLSERAGLLKFRLGETCSRVTEPQLRGRTTAGSLRLP